MTGRLQTCTTVDDLIEALAPHRGLTLDCGEGYRHDQARRSRRLD